jgi:hypothetical protein
MQESFGVLTALRVGKGCGVLWSGGLALFAGRLDE